MRADTTVNSAVRPLLLGVEGQTESLTIVQTDLQAAIVPLVLILGGSTVSSVLLGLVPGWVVTPIPVATYGCASCITASMYNR